MQQITSDTGQRTRWTHGKALERRLGLPRGMLLANAARLDGAMIDQFAGILTVTVRDWLRR